MPVLTEGPKPFTAQFQPERFFFSHEMKPEETPEAAARIGELISKNAAEFAATMGRDDARDVQVQAAQMHAHYLDQINKATMAGDGSALAQIQDNYQNDIQHLQDNAKTKDGYQTAQVVGADLNARLGQRIVEGTAQVAGAKLDTQFDDMGKAQTAIVSGEPFNDATYTAAKAQYAQLVNSATNVPYAARQKVLQNRLDQLAESRALAQATLDPSHFLKNVPDDLTPQAHDDAVKTAQRQIQSNVVAQESAIRLKLMQQEQASQNTMATLFPKLSDPATIASLPTLVQSGRLLPRDAENMTEYAHRLATEGPASAQSDPATFNSYLQRLSLSAGSPGALDSDSLKAAVQSDLSKGKLALPDYLHLQELADKVQTGDPNYKRVLSMAELALKQFQMFDPVNAAADAQKFSMDAVDALKKTEGAGNNPATTIFNEKSPEFLLSPQRLASYRGAGVAAQAAGAKAGSSYQVGQVVMFAQGPFKFKGGDPTNKDNWEPAK